MTDFSNIANEHLFNGRPAEALVYSLLALPANPGGWDLVRLAVAARRICGPAEAVHILETFAKQNNSALVRFAKIHFLLECGRVRDASDIDAAFDTRDNLEPTYIKSFIKLKTLQGLHEEAAQIFDRAQGQLAKSKWAHFSALKDISPRLQPEDLDKFVSFFIAQHDDLSSEELVFLALHQVRCSRELTDIDLLDRMTDEDRQFMSDARYFLREFPPEKVASEAEAALSDVGINDRELFDAILKAARDEQPFSFVRMGDGEGRFVFDYSPFEQIKKLSEQTAKRIWLWNSTEEPGLPFFEELKSAFASADVVGINPPVRVMNEYRAGILGYAGVATGNRYCIENARANKSQLVTFNWANITLDGMGLFKRLASEGGRIRIVGPHLGLVDKFKSMGASDVELFQIPSEGNTMAKNTSIKGPHYPEAFRTCQEWIARHRGGVFIVAGGVFGKIYCKWAKEAGGVALDVGALADRWVGMHTR